MILVQKSTSTSTSAATDTTNTAPSHSGPTPVTSSEKSNNNNNSKPSDSTKSTLSNDETRKHLILKALEALQQAVKTQFLRQSISAN